MNNSIADGICVEDLVSIPEADIALCNYHGKRFNVKFDLNYGIEVESVDSFAEIELDFIKAIILKNIH